MAALLIIAALTMNTSRQNLANIRRDEQLTAVLEALWSDTSSREHVQALLEPVRLGMEGARCCLAILKIAGADLARLQTMVAAAQTDYRDVLALAESPRQMVVPPGSDPTRIASARRADRDEYQAWLKSLLPEPTNAETDINAAEHKAAKR
jgi:hypothetical protein